MTKKWERLQLLDDVQRRGLIDAPIRVLNPDEQQKNYETLNTNITMLLVLKDEIDDLIKWGYAVNLRRGIREESPEESSRVKIEISDNLGPGNTRKVDIILPKAYLETAAHRGFTDISPTGPSGIIQDSVNLDELIEYARKAVEQAVKHLEWLNEEVERKP
ncbi:MAG: hypothetical protein A4E48_02743 [Methanosaeta sp. PtaU1.Bin060]|nr:MAG: hypothetical protein A4E48_02743 [Methanosaeta sp. PtaU1.Bin060]